MKKYYFLITLASILLIGCQKNSIGVNTDDVNPNVPREVIFAESPCLILDDFYVHVNDSGTITAQRLESSSEYIIKQVYEAENGEEEILKAVCSSNLVNKEDISEINLNIDREVALKDIKVIEKDNTFTVNWVIDNVTYKYMYINKRTEFRPEKMEIATAAMDQYRWNLRNLKNPPISPDFLGKAVVYHYLNEDPKGKNQPIESYGTVYSGDPAFGENNTDRLSITVFKDASMDQIKQLTRDIAERFLERAKKYPSYDRKKWAQFVFTLNVNYEGKEEIIYSGVIRGGEYEEGQVE